jgi:hypothetical protein
MQKEDKKRSANLSRENQIRAPEMPDRYDGLKTGEDSRKKLRCKITP